METYHEDNTHPGDMKCRDCPERFMRKKDLMNHRVVEHPSKRICKKFPNCFRGNECWYVHPEEAMDTSPPLQNTEEEIQATSTQPQELEFKCRTCKESFATKNQLMKHRKAKHPHQTRPCILYPFGRCTRSAEECWYMHPHQGQDNHSPRPAPNLNNVVDFPLIQTQQHPPDQITTLAKLVQEMQMNQKIMQEKMEQMLNM